MMMISHQQLNLTYAKSNSTFFSKIADVRSIIKQYNHTQSHVFTDRDETEIRRGMGYAIFDELKNKDIQINSTNMRNCLSIRGVTGLEFQNKILSMLLQHRIGLHFHMASIIWALLSNTDDQFIIFVQSDDYNIALEINDNDNVTLVIKIIYDSMINRTPEPMIEACIKIQISLETVAITDCTLKKLSDNPTATAIYDSLEENQQNIFMKLLTFIMHLLGFNNELILEKRESDEQVWGQSP